VLVVDIETYFLCCANEFMQGFLFFFFFLFLFFLNSLWFQRIPLLSSNSQLPPDSFDRTIWYLIETSVFGWKPLSLHAKSGAGNRDKKEAKEESRKEVQADTNEGIALKPLLASWKQAIHHARHEEAERGDRKPAIAAKKETKTNEQNQRAATGKNGSEIITKSEVATKPARPRCPRVSLATRRKKTGPNGTGTSRNTIEESGQRDQSKSPHNEKTKRKAEPKSKKKRIQAIQDADMRCSVQNRRKTDEKKRNRLQIGSKTSKKKQRTETTANRKEAQRAGEREKAIKLAGNAVTYKRLS
jgi:hypothetical protein